MATAAHSPRFWKGGSEMSGREMAALVFAAQACRRDSGSQAPRRKAGAVEVFAIPAREQRQGSLGLPGQHTIQPVRLCLRNHIPAPQPQRAR